jgi:chorismate mutase
MQVAEANVEKPSQQPSFYLVREDILPEALIKTFEAKALLSKGECTTVNEATEKVGISRSAYYKYKDGIFPLHRMDRDWIVTISMEMEHRSGVLSHVLSLVAAFHGNVLTIHQTIPLQGVAHVTLSVEMNPAGESVDAMVHAIRSVEGVRRTLVIGQGQ